ncbi:MAG: hypothetical protein LW854_09610 [Rubrivivax sp.]|jgi:hypothetical protein|nr:hypothetical protein [Rubrivivax sp.]
MTRLDREFRRLFLPSATPGADGTPTVRALVLELARPAQWQPLSAVWRGVQSELGLPAPAIAVNGKDGLQLWFSLAEGVEPDHGRALLDGLCQRYLADVPPHRVDVFAEPEPLAVPRALGHAPQWAAFVAPDLAPLFEDTPWLDMPPSQEGQADLLSRVASVSPAALAEALGQLAPPPAEALEPGTSAQPAVPTAPTRTAADTAAEQAAVQFLLQVVQDEAAPLALRVDAAKALLPHRGYGQ